MESRGGRIGQAKCVRDAVSQSIRSNLPCVRHVITIFVVFLVVVVAVAVVGGGGTVSRIYRYALLEVLEGFQMVVVIFFIWWGWRSPSRNCWEKVWRFFLFLLS